jgi:type I restriction enzyme S subunit
MGYINTFIYDEEKAIFTTTVGAKVMTPMLLNGKFSLSQNCVLFKKTTNDVDERYFYYQLFPLFQRQKDDIPSHMQPSLRIGDLNKYVVVYPPFEEQQAIADYLDKEMKYINDMIAKIEKSIELLEEYKTSLISHAVSGKIRIS